GSMAWLRNDALSLLPDLIIYTALTFVVAFVLAWLFRRQKKIWLIEQIPGPKALPILGNALEVNVEPREVFERVCEFCDYGSISRTWLGCFPYCWVSEAKNAE
ncbi:hypothetical protein OTU49_014613, partial [Cherax quadricarinatus]